MSSSTNMTSNLRYISCPVSQLDLLEPVGVQTQIEGSKDIEYLPTSVFQDGAPIIFEIGKDERYSDLCELVIKTVIEYRAQMVLLWKENNLQMRLRLNHSLRLVL